MTNFTVSEDRKTITINLATPFPGEYTDDAALAIVIEVAPLTVGVRYLNPDVVGVIRSYLASQTNPNGTMKFADIEALLFATISQFFVANVAEHYPASIAAALTAVQQSQQALQASIGGIVAAQVKL